LIPVWTAVKRVAGKKKAGRPSFGWLRKVDSKERNGETWANEHARAKRVFFLSKVQNFNPRQLENFQLLCRDSASKVVWDNSRDLTPIRLLVNWKREMVLTNLGLLVDGTIELCSCVAVLYLQTVGRSCRSAGSAELGVEPDRRFSGDFSKALPDCHRSTRTPLPWVVSN
jgi:hypothetical protein